uniref:Uncharacterized protein n=1 Tax=Anguilla anguilla TaxID=7936 RepID=A0A0E9XAI6_ANGAN
MLCFSKNTDCLSVAPVRYPVVQISFKLHILNEKTEERMRQKREKRKRGRERKIKYTYVLTDAGFKLTRSFNFFSQMLIQTCFFLSMGNKATRLLHVSFFCFAFFSVKTATSHFLKSARVCAIQYFSTMYSPNHYRT